MKRLIPVMMVLSLSLVACEQHIKNTSPPAGVDNENPERNRYNRNLGTMTLSDQPGVQSDNNERNMQDRDLRNMTPSDQRRMDSDTQRDLRNQNLGTMTPSDSRGVQSDNTERNMRDRDLRTMTPSDQSESEADRAITQRIRQSIMEDDSLSTNAKNIKIITVRGVVTLRGPVASSQEKDLIAQKVSAIQGVVRVDNQLEITQNLN